MKISILPSEVVNQIAAGEVVERPSHLVKELVENSLDAKATKIEVEFSDGGRNVRVSDNGSGMDADDLALALQRHATSKIVESKDLFALQSYGFRGEALASISAVSNLSLISKKGESAYQVENEFGKVSGVNEVGANQGTTVWVRDLFSNMPARLKFLKSDVAESTQIKNTLKAFALIHPEIELRVRSEKPLFTFKAQSSMLERAKEVLGTKEIFETEYQLEKVNARILYCSPHVVTGNSKAIWIFVQKRWVQDRSIQAAVIDAYRGLLMHDEFPCVVVDLTVDPSDVDVNIHPTKSTVKFRDNSIVFRAVHRALRQGLEQAPWIIEKPPETQTAKPPVVEMREPVQAKFVGTVELEQTQLRQKFSEPLAAYFARDPATGVAATGVTSASAATPVPIANMAMPSKRYWSQLQVLGQAKQTYILTQNDSTMVIVDQHAAHERVIYERLMQSWNEKKMEIQDFLFPLSIALEGPAIEAILTHQNDLEQMGFQVEAMGPEHLAVRSAPAILKESAIHDSIEKLAQEILERGGGFAIEKSVMHIFATMACHSAIRAGQALSNEEMKSLLQQMDESALSSFCPHGRPVSVDYPFYKLEKDFGRII